MSEEGGKQTTKEGGHGKPSSPVSAAPADSGKREGSISRKFLANITQMLGLGKKKSILGGDTTDVSTSLAHQRTDLAVERSYMASDRTLMAWIRTSLSMISFGFTIGKLGQVIKNVTVERMLGGVRVVSVVNIAYFLVVIGTLALFLASLQHRQRIHELREMGLKSRFSITFFVAILLVALGAFALTSLMMAL